MDLDANGSGAGIVDPHSYSARPCPSHRFISGPGTNILTRSITNLRGTSREESLGI